jgi:8-oxo-dGTP diphosphatase
MTYTYKYPRPAVTADCVVITKEAEPKVLLIQRGNMPFKGGWAFPGGFMNMDETTEQCAIRELEEETGLRLLKVQQIGAYSKVDRDPRGRTVTVAYLAIVDEPIAVTGQDDAAKAEWWPLSDLPYLAFDHYDIMQDAIKVYAQEMEGNEKAINDRFKEQKERMHELSKQMREQCAHVQELCNNFTKKEQE